VLAGTRSTRLLWCPSWWASAIEPSSDLMVFTFARVVAAIGMKVEDYLIQGRRGWVRLHEKAASATTCRRITTLTNIWKRTSRESIKAYCCASPTGREIQDYSSEECRSIDSEPFSLVGDIVDCCRRKRNPLSRIGSLETGFEFTRN
jgi:hypothetical protein